MLRWCGCGRDTASSAASPSEGEKSNDGLFKRVWSRYLRLRQSPMSSLFVVCVAIFTDMLVYGMVVPLFVPEILQVTTIEIGVLFAMYAGGLLIATPIFGVLTDKFGRKWPMLCGLLGLGAATTILAFIKFFPFMALARCFQGIAAASTWVTGLALVADTFPTEQLGWAMGVVMSVCQVGILIGPTFGGFVYEFGGYRMPFIIASGVAVLDGVLRILLVSDDMPSWRTQTVVVPEQSENAREKKRRSAGSIIPVASYSSKEIQKQYLLNPSVNEAEYEDIEAGQKQEDNSLVEDLQRSSSETEKLMAAPTDSTPLLSNLSKPETKAKSTEAKATPEEPPSMWDLLQNKSIMITSVVVLLAANALTVLEPTLPTHLEHVLDASPMLVGLVFMCESLVDIIASPFVGWCCDRVGNKPLMIAGMLLAGLVMPIVALPTEWWQQFLAVSAMAICNALMLTPTLPELAVQVDAMGGGAYGQVYAIYNFFYSLGMLGGPLVGSILADHLGLFLTMVAFGGVVSLFSPVLIMAYLFSKPSPTPSPIDTSPAVESSVSPATEAEDGNTKADQAKLTDEEESSVPSSPSTTDKPSEESGGPIQPPAKALVDPERAPLLPLAV